MPSFPKFSNIFRNIRTGYYIKITKNPFEQISKYRKVYGKFSKKQCEFKGDSAPLFGVDKKEWVIVWKTNGWEPKDKNLFYKN